MRILVTGTPGTGKTILARELSKELGIPLVPVNSIIKEKKLGKRVGKELEVNLVKLRKELLKEFSGKKSLVCESHLLCEVKLPCDLILILRCNPLVLEKRLAARKGYSRNKIAGNCLVEALDYCSLKAGENYSKGKILEIDFTKPSLERVLKALKSRKGDSVNWSKELLKGGFRKIIEAEEGI